MSATARVAAAVCALAAACGTAERRSEESARVPALAVGDATGDHVDADAGRIVWRRVALQRAGDVTVALTLDEGAGAAGDLSVFLRDTGETLTQAGFSPGSSATSVTFAGFAGDVLMVRVRALEGRADLRLRATLAASAAPTATRPGPGAACPEAASAGPSLAKVYLVTPDPDDDDRVVFYLDKGHADGVAPGWRGRIACVAPDFEVFEVNERSSRARVATSVRGVPEIRHVVRLGPGPTPRAR